MDIRDLIKQQPEDDFLKRVATIVLAGGQGTRLFPLTSTRCKPAVCFGGRYRLIDVPISNSLNSRINQIFIISQYFASELHQHILSTYHLDMFRSGGLELLTPQETLKGRSWFKGTADAIRQSLDYILQCSAEYFMILSGDQLYNMDLMEMLAFAKRKDADLTIATIPVLKPEAKRMGLLQINPTSTITEFVEKPTEEEVLKEFKLDEAFLKKAGCDHTCDHYLASMGIYIFKRSALIEILRQEGDDFGKNLIPPFIEKAKCSAYIFEGYWEDIGTVASFYKANLILTKGQGLNTYEEENRIYSAPQHIPNALICGTRVSESIIGQGGIIEADEITGSIIGVRALIKKGTKIRDSIIMGNRTYHPFMNQEMAEAGAFSIGENCTIHKAIIDEEAKIGNNVQLINKDNLNTFDGDGIYIRDGIIIVTSGTELPDGFVL